MSKIIADSPTLAEKIIAFNEGLVFRKRLPKGFSVMNPFRENPEALSVMEQFYRKFYNDHRPRKFLIGINPGRFGAGITGVPFTDPKHLRNDCGISISGKSTHEPSATFIYNMIQTYGGVKKFYKDVYIHSLFPLAIVRKNDKGNDVNCNYYDDKRLWKLMKPFIVAHLKTQIDLGMKTDVGFMLGKKNAKFMAEINNEEHFFGRLEILEHPRYVQQYKSKESEAYAEKFVQILKNGGHKTI